MEEILRLGFEQYGLKVSEETIAALRRYYTLLEERNRVMNLTAITGEEEAARLHFLDCAALLRYKDFTGAEVLDVGSGAGFPGLVLKILCPGMHLTMLDSQQKRVNFQQEVVQELGLTGVNSVHDRAEEAAGLRGKFDYVLSRAVAKLPILAEMCIPQIKVGGIFIAMKGPDPSEEVREARRAFTLTGGNDIRIEKYTIPGTDITHSLVFVRKDKPSPAAYPRRYSNIKKNPL